MMSNHNTEEIQVLAAGSLRAAFAALSDAFHATNAPARLQLRHGPAGLLREQIEAGAAFDVFASANLEHPRRLMAQQRAHSVARFARNRLIATVRAGLGITTDNLVDMALRPELRLATSTPGADPGGDYAQQFFDAVEAALPGKGAALRAKAVALVGGRDSAPVPEGQMAATWLITTGQTDIMLGYASYARKLGTDAGIALVPLPEAFNPVAEYGVCLAPQAPAVARGFAEFLLSATGQSILAAHGFLAPG